VEGDLLVTLEEAMRSAVRAVSLRRTDPRTGQSDTHTFKVRIPAGVHDGQLIRVPGQGEPGSGGAGAGDLFLRVRLAAHPDFRIRGADLLTDIDLAPWEAVLGATVSVPTLDGPVSVRIPPGTNTGQQLRIRGRGLPVGKDGGRGDLYGVVSIQMPSTVTSEERELWERLAKASRFNPRES
jgi:curved DNA-binding protein